ncbi:MAG: hypothetical protein WBA13_06765 [Microcoleaceae cyanobacterium]
MSRETATQQTIQFIESQRKELKLTIKQLENELDKARRDYDSFTALLDKLQEDENSSSEKIQVYFDIEAINSSNSGATSFNKTSSEEIDEYVDEMSDYDEDNDDFEENEEDNSSPKDWLYPQYQNRPIEDVICEILRVCQPAKPADIAHRIYQIEEDDLNFRRARNSANAALTNGKKTGKWKLLKRGVYVLNSYPEPYTNSVNQNANKGYQIAQ